MLKDNKKKLQQKTLRNLILKLIKTKDMHLIVSNLYI